MRPEVVLGPRVCVGRVECQASGRETSLAPALAWAKETLEFC